MEEGFKVPIFPAKPPQAEESAAEPSETVKKTIEIPYRGEKFIFIFSKSFLAFSFRSPKMERPNTSTNLLF